MNDNLHSSFISFAHTDAKIFDCLRIVLLSLPWILFVRAVYEYFTNISNKNINLILWDHIVVLILWRFCVKRSKNQTFKKMPDSKLPISLFLLARNIFVRIRDNVTNILISTNVNRWNQVVCFIFRILRRKNKEPFISKKCIFSWSQWHSSLLAYVLLHFQRQRIFSIDG